MLASKLDITVAVEPFGVTVGRARTACRWRKPRMRRRRPHGEPTLWHTLQLTLNTSQRAAMQQLLSTQGFAVLDGILSPEQAQATRLEYRTLFSRYGKVLESDTHRAGIRSDYVQTACEHEAQAVGLPAIAFAIAKLKGFGHELARMFDEPLTVAPAAQLALFAGNGTCYKRHGDNLYQPERAPDTSPSGFDNWRAFTLLMYFNGGWVPEDGGCLRIYGSSGGVAPLTPLPVETLRETTAYEDVEPRAGRVVVFNSLLHHEVLPVDGLRLAMTIWLWKEDGNLEKFNRS